MGRTVRLHRKYGLNPTISVCFICGEENEVVLLGAAYSGEAPMKMCLNKEPCQKCRDYTKKGVILISVRDGEAKTNSDNPYRTGRLCVLRLEAARRMFRELPPRRIAFIEDSLWERLGLPNENIGQENGENGKERNGEKQD